MFLNAQLKGILSFFVLVILIVRPATAFKFFTILNRNPISS